MQLVNNNVSVKLILVLTIVFKLILVTTFISGFKNDFFIPFVLEFLQEGGDPWQTAWQQGNQVDFPYPPIMLYILSFFLAIPHFLGAEAQWVYNFFYGIPLVIADSLLFLILVSMFPWRKTELYFYYFISPVVLFAIYIHGQLDILPTIMVLASFKLLTDRRYLIAAIIFGFAMATKFHTVVLLPLMVIYLLQQKKYSAAGLFILLPLAVYGLFISPFIQEQGFRQIVLNNEKQKMVFESFFQIGEIKIYLPVLAVMFIYLRFTHFKKTNNDLLFATAGALLSVFLVLIKPAPGWFVWVIPFLTIFLIRYYHGIQQYIFFAAFNIAYLVYFIFFHQYEAVPFSLPFMEFAHSLHINNEIIHNLSFTTLVAVFLLLVYLSYRSGSKSNQVYTMDKAFVLGVGGDSGAGKTTLISQINNIFTNQVIEIEGDGDHKWERGNENWNEFTHLNPKANLLHQQADQVKQLKRREFIKRVDYDHNTGQFTEAGRINPKDFIVVAGLHPFYLPKMRKVIDLKIFMDLDERLRKSWKISRDSKKRGYTSEQVLAALATREADAKKYIQPQRQFADMVIRFFPVQEDQFEDHIYQGQIGLEIEIDASLPIENIVQELTLLGVHVNWDYSQDLSTQIITIENRPEGLDIEKLARQNIINLHELCPDATWQNGFDGLIQFFILVAISETMQERANSND